jgi:hypothetical protein
VSFSIESGKEGLTPATRPAKPLFLVSIVAPDGDTCYLTTSAYYGAQNITYNSQTYLARILQNNIQAITATSPQGYDSVPGFTLTLADADGSLWMNHCQPHGWRGAAVTLTMILWDVVTNSYSTNAYQLTFIGGNPQHNYARGETTLDVQASTNWSRLKVPSVPLQYRCPWDFPATALQRLDGLKNPTSIFYQCGYSPDCSGGCGNPVGAGQPDQIANTTISALTPSSTTGTVASTASFPATPFQATLGTVATGGLFEEVLVTNVVGTTVTITRAQHGTTAGTFGGGTAFLVPYTTCDQTRSSPSSFAVGCMARMGNHNTTIVAPDGDLCHDLAGTYTGRYGGVTWMAPSTWYGSQYVSGQKAFGFNAPNSALAGSFYNFVYGTQWVNCAVLAPAGDPNTNQCEAVACVAAFGPTGVAQVVVNGVVVGINSSGEPDPNFTFTYVNQGGRNGALYGGAIWNSHGDPHGSVLCLHICVPMELAAPGSVMSVQALVIGPPMLNVYVISAIVSGVVTFTGPNYSCAGKPPFVVIIQNNSNAALNGTWNLSTWNTPLYTITLSGTSASGTGGACFFYGPPDLYDTGGDIITNPTGNFQNVAGPAANIVFAALDLITWGNIQMSQIDPVSWYNAAQIAHTALSYVGPNGATATHAQFKASFALQGTSQKTLARALIELRNAGNMMIGANSTTGLIQCFFKQTLADQQPAPITGSNYNTGVSSITAAGGAATGYFAYVFNETNIEKDSFKITTTPIESTPNTVSFGFQDEQNGYQQDSITEIDPIAYAYSGNQEIAVPVPINGVPNFDQASRVSNVQLAEALFGNARNDPGGTQYFEFTVNHRVLHLLGRLGYICGLTWQARGVGPLQPVRVITIQPDTDGEHWHVKCSWHNDIWYTYSYGQNPTPYQINPLLAPQIRPPYPWRPYGTTWGSSDPLWPGAFSFTLGIATANYPAQLTFTGVVPVNAQPSTMPPLVPLQASTANTGGSIKPGTYLIAFSSNGSSGPISNFVTAIVPAGTNTNTITVQFLTWQSGAAPSIQPYIGTSSLNMRACFVSSYTHSTNDANGNPTSYTFTSVSPDGIGLPDMVFSKFLIEETSIVHGGDWGDAITLVSSNVLTFGAVTWTTNQWAGYVLSLYYRPGVVTQPALNIAISSSTGTTLTMATTGFLAGDVVVCRMKPSTFSSNTIGDANLVNAYAPSGLIVNAEVGNLVLIIAGTGAGQPPATIASNTATVFTINGTFYVTPDATSVFIVMAPGIAYSYTTHTFSNAGAMPAQTIATTPAITALTQSLLIRISAMDSTGNNRSPVTYQPFRELYVPPQSVGGTVPTVTANANVTLVAQGQNVDADATSAAFTITIPAFAGWIGATITITKIDASTNAVNWQLAGGSDSVPGFGSFGSLTAQGQAFSITALTA